MIGFSDRPDLKIRWLSDNTYPDFITDILRPLNLMHIDKMSTVKHSF